MAFNTTQAAGVQRSLHSTLESPGSRSVSYPAQQDGYALGRLLRRALDHVGNTYQRMQHFPVDYAKERTYKIYQMGLKKSVPQLELALFHLYKNPRDPSALREVKQLAHDYAYYLTPSEDVHLRDMQRIMLKPLEERIATWAPKHIHDVLRKFLPILFQEEKKLTKRALLQAGAFPAVFDLTTLNGNNGFAIPGIAIDDGLGSSVSTAGDLNGDGREDLVLGAYFFSSYSGAAYVLFGQAGGWTPSFNLNTLNGSNGFAIPAIAAGGSLGYSVSTAGDLNSDGRADLVLGAPGVSSGAGVAYVLFGQAGGWAASFSLNTLNGSNGFTIPGIVATGNLGSSVSTAGDLNGDGRVDLVLGAEGVSSGAGAAYVLFGQAGGWSASFNLTTLNGTNGFAIPGIVTGGELGFSVSTNGDLNGDGRTDLVIGAPYVSSTVGAAYVLFGQASGWPASFNLNSLNGTNGFAVPGMAAGGELGWSVSTAGDLNGDGKADLVLGAPGVSSGAGVAYVLFGQAGGWAASFNLATLNGINGFAIPGIAFGGNLGRSVSTAGDLNGDGRADLVLGAYLASRGYVLFGQAGGWPALFNLTTLNGSNGFAIRGSAASTHLGSSVSTEGDLNSDGQADLVLGATPSSSFTGAAYVIFGRNTSAAPIASTPPTSTPTTSTQIPTPSSVVSVSQIPTLVTSSSTSGVTPPNDPTIGIAVGVSAGVLVLGGVVGVIVFLRFKKKACFAQDARPRSVSAVSITEKAYS